MPYTHAKATMVKPGPAVLRARASATPPTPPAPAPAPAATPSARPPPPKRQGLGRWIASHKVLATAIALLMVSATVGIATVIINQPIVATPTAGSSPVCFAAGDDIASLVALGLAATPSVSTGCGSVTITIYGIPGATALQLGEILKLSNADTADNVDFAVTLAATGSPSVTLTSFTMTFDDNGNTRTLDVENLGSAGPYTLSDGETWEFNVNSLVMTAAAAGSQGALTITATITQV